MLLHEIGVFALRRWIGIRNNTNINSCGGVRVRIYLHDREKYLFMTILEFRFAISDRFRLLRRSSDTSGTARRRGYFRVVPQTNGEFAEASRTAPPRSVLCRIIDKGAIERFADLARAGPRGGPPAPVEKKRETACLECRRGAAMESALRRILTNSRAECLVIDRGGASALFRKPCIIPLRISWT